jgi:hypothetical protein
MASPNGHVPSSDGPFVVVHQGRRILLPPVARLLLTAAQQRERARLLAGRYFLVNMRLGEMGEVFRCGQCNGKHDRLTRYCLDRPFSGLMGGLYGFVATVQGAASSGLLSPEATARVSHVQQLLTRATGQPDLADSHPQLARKLAGPDSHGRDLDIGMVSLGLLERVEVRDAQRLLDRINLRARAYGRPILAVPGLRHPG